MKIIKKMWIYLIYSIYNKTVSLSFYLLGYKKPQNLKKIKNILLFKTGSMGDNIITFPMIASIKKIFPNIKITILTNSGNKNLVSIENLIDRTYIEEFINYTEKPKKELFSLLKNKQFDLVIDLTKPSSLIGVIRNMIFFKIIGIKYGIGWHISELPFFRKWQDDFELVGSEREKYLSFLKELDIKPCPNDYILGISEKDVKYINKILKKNNLLQKRLIAFVVGSKRPTNRWPIEYFEKVMKYVKEKGYEPIIIGGKEDIEITKKLKESYVNFCGKLTPLQSAELMKRCLLTISNDTGPMHLSYAVGTLVIAIFSARDFRYKWYPPKDKGIVLRDEKIKCRLCYKESCDTLECLKSISPNLVISKLDTLLNMKNERGKI